LHYVDGDYRDPETFERLKQSLGNAGVGREAQRIVEGDDTWHDPEPERSAPC
jgi:hypothetical protein